jgi:hypothetical protein
VNSTYLSIEFKLNTITEFNYNKEMIPGNLVMNECEENKGK